jgi:hypothetical protein
VARDLVREATLVVAVHADTRSDLPVPEAAARGAAGVSMTRQTHGAGRGGARRGGVLGGCGRACDSRTEPRSAFPRWLDIGLHVCEFGSYLLAVALAFADRHDNAAYSMALAIYLRLLRKGGA